MNLRDWIKHSLGYPLVNVELTEEQYQVAYEFAVQNYLAYGEFSDFEDLKIVPAKAGNSLILINNDPPNQNEKIIDVDFISYVIYAPYSYFGLNYDFQEWEKRLIMKEIFGGGHNFNDGFGQFLGALGWIEDLRIALGQFPTWHIFNRKYIRLSPVPTVDLNIGIVYYNITSTKEFEDDIIFKELMLGKAMVILGEAYSKYGSIPATGGGEISLKDLITRGEAKIEKAITELKNNQMYPGIYVD